MRWISWLSIGLGALSLPAMAQPDYEEVLRAAAADIPGAAAAVVTPDGTWTGATGWADLRTRRPMTASTRCYIGSISKTLTAAALMVLRDRGELDPSATLAQYLPGWALGDIGTVRVRDLLTHTSGIPREGGLDYWFTGIFPTREGLRDQLRGQSLVSRPGEQWMYSNVGYAVLGRVLAVRSNLAFEDVVRRRLMEPLGMLRSGPRGPAPPDLARAYTPPNHDTGREGRVFAGIGRRVGERRERVYDDAGAMAPAFGMYSTAEDLARFVSMLLGRGPALLSDESRALMLEMQHPFEADPRSGWTYGLRRTHDEHGLLHRHNGWFAAYRSHISLRPDEGVAIVVLTNADDGGPEAIAAALTNAALAVN